MRALVTGAAGFVGHHMADQLQRCGWIVSRCDTNLGWDALNIFGQDITRDCIQHYDLVVHAAASSPHRAAIDGEPQHMARNLHLDAAMFDWAVRTNQGRVLYLSSSAAYPVRLQTGHPSRMLREDWVRLDDVSQPDAAYGWTKLTGEKLAAAARDAGLNVTVVRPFSGYGEDQSEDFPFRALVERARRREDPYVIWGTGNQVRDWVHIADVVAASLAVVESGTDEPVNLCTGVGASMMDLARLACAQAGYRPEFAFRTDMPAGVAYRVGDPTRLHEMYTPQVSLDEGVKRTLGGSA